MSEEQGNEYFCHIPFSSLTLVSLTHVNVHVKLYSFKCSMATFAIAPGFRFFPGDDTRRLNALRARNRMIMKTICFLPKTVNLIGKALLRNE